MIEKIKYFYSLKTTKILTIILLSFFLYIILNFICSFITFLIVYRDILHTPHFYGQATICVKNVFNITSVFVYRTTLRISIFIFLKASVLYAISQIKSSHMDYYIKSIFCTIIMTDFVYVILHLLFSYRIDWDFYFYSSHFVGGGLSLFIPSWLFFGISGILNIIVFRKYINDFRTLTKYNLFALLSFFVQFGIAYIVFGKIFYKH